MKNKTETCKCGCNKDRHGILGCFDCNCKKFKPQSQSQMQTGQERMSDTRSDALRGSLSSKKVYASGKDDTGSFGNWCFQIEDVREKMKELKEELLLIIPEHKLVINRKFHKVLGEDLI